MSALGSPGPGSASAAPAQGPPPGARLRVRQQPSARNTRAHGRSGRRTAGTAPAGRGPRPDHDHPSRSVTSSMTRDDNPENTTPASSLMSHAADHARFSKPCHSLTRRHHRKCDRAVEITVPCQVRVSRMTCISARSGRRWRAERSHLHVSADGRQGAVGCHGPRSGTDRASAAQCRSSERKLWSLLKFPCGLQQEILGGGLV